MARNSTVGLALFMVAAVTQPATAEIRCNGNYQIVAGQEIATPYCGDQYLAVVARDYGIRVTGAQIRNNPATKLEVCQIAGRDNRAQQACASSGIFDRGRRN